MHFRKCAASSELRHSSSGLGRVSASLSDIKYLSSSPICFWTCLGHFGIWRAFVMLPEAMKYFGGQMAKIIEFYIPQSFRKVSKWFPPAERGKVLAFPLAVRQSA